MGIQTLNVESGNVFLFIFFQFGGLDEFVLGHRMGGSSQH